MQFIDLIFFFQLLTAMYSLAMEKTTGHGSRLNGKIKDVAEEWEKIAQDHFQVN